MSGANKGGRPAHKKNAATERAVEVLAFGGYNQEEIAGALDMSIPTLCKYYKNNIANGKAKVMGAIIKKEVETALSDKPEGSRSRQFFMKAEPRFREARDLNVSGELKIKSIERSFVDTETPER